MNKTKIEWCDMTVNPIIGCMRGCTYCYAKKMNDRFKFVEDFENPEFFPEQLNKLCMKQPKVIFVGSMCDLFGEGILFNHREWLDEVFEKCCKNYRHRYLFLTKNPHAYDDYDVPRGSNFWYGQTLDCKRTMLTKYSDISNTFLSIEPILDEVKCF